MRRAPFAVVLAVGALLLTAAGLRAGDDAGKDGKAAPGARRPSTSAGAEGGAPRHEDGGPALDYERSYREALHEARIRNVPIFVSRHKDF